jgi:type IV secretory pathway VirB2 component (pilin)
VSSLTSHNIKKNKEIVMAKLTQKSAAVKIAALAAVASTFAMADDQGDATFGTLKGEFVTWLQGNLGKLLALLGFVGTFIVYMMTHRGSILFVGIIISLIAGGMVGISETFFNAGADAFNPTN